MRFQSIKSLFVSSAALVMAATGTAYAHHSFAMFDFTNTVSCQATVTEFRWTNPHVTMLVQAAAKAGDAPDTWSIELTSPGNLTRIGWTRHTFKPGDVIDLQFNPLRDGKHGGAFKQAKIHGSDQVWASSVRDANDAPNLK